jgi:nucleoside-diphosphate-sugar epimerase
MLEIASNSYAKGTLRLVVGCGYVGERVAIRWKNRGDCVLAVTRSEEKAQRFASLGLHPVVWDWRGSEDPVPRFLDTLGRMGLTRSALVERLATILISVSHAVAPGVSPEMNHVLGLQQLSAGLRELGSAGRWIYLSTTGVFAESSSGVDCDETSDVAPTRPGSIAAYAGERWMSGSGLEHVILRPCGIYGPDRVPNLTALQRGEVLEIDPDSTLNLIHVEDLVQVIDAVALGPLKRSLYCVCDGRSPTRGEYYRWIARRMGWPEPRFVVPTSSEFHTAGRLVTGGEASSEHRIGSSPRRRSQGNKRVRVERLLADYGISFLYPSYQDGLSH